MRFELSSTFYGLLKEDSFCKEDVKRIRKVLLPYCTEEDGTLYIDINYMSELQSIQDALNKVYSDLDVPWSRVSFVVDFEDMSIEIYDYFRE